MADLNFPMEAFLQANQQKDINDMATNPPLGTLLAQGITKGVTTIADRQRQEKDAAKANMIEFIKNEVKDKDFVDVSGKPYDMNVKLQALQEYSKGNYALRQNPDTGDIELATKKGDRIGMFKAREDKIKKLIPDPTNIDMLKQALPGYNIQLGVEVAVPTTTYNKMFAPEKKVNITQTSERVVPEGMEITKIDAQGRPIMQKKKDMAEDINKQALKTFPKAKKEYDSSLTETEVLKSSINEALQSAPKIPTGWAGRMKLKAGEMIGSNDPVYNDVQNVINALSKIQLMNLQFTKGAISDKEMSFFADSVANGDYKVLPRMITSLNRAMKDIEIRENNLKKNFQENYGSLTQQEPVQTQLKQGNRFKILGVK